MPAVVLDRELRIERFERVVFKSGPEGWIQKCGAVMVVVRVLHRRDTRAVENIRDHLLKLLELGRHFLKQCVVMRVLPSGGRNYGRRSLDLSRKEEDESLTPQPTVDHSLPVAHKPFVTAAPCPDVRRGFSLLMIPQQLGAIVRIAEPLHLKTELVVQAGKQQRELILKRVEVFGSSRTQIRGFDDKTLRDVTAFAQAVEDDEVANEITVRGGFKHGRWKRRLGAHHRARLEDQSRGLLATAQKDRCRVRRVFPGVA